MIKVTVELVSAISPTRNRVLGIAEIHNDGTGTMTTGNYKVQLSKAGAKSHETWRRGEVTGFPRKRLGGWDLLYLALKNTVGFRHRE